MDRGLLLRFSFFKLLSLISILILDSQYVAAQQKQLITGTVVSSDDGLGIPGATVIQEGAATGTSTDQNGNFRLSITPGARVIFKFLGYTEQRIKIDNSESVTVRLKPAANDLNEVVITGYTQQKRSDVTGAISTISGQEILKSPVTNVTNALVGKVPGVVAQQTSGKPGANAANLYIRGRVSNNSTALIIVDGVERQSFGDIDPSEIESINILKDASSAAMYGIKGANGVIVVTTKKGRDGKARISLSANYGIVGYTGVPKVLGAYESALLHTEGQINSGSARTFSDEDLEIFRNGTGDPLLYPNVNWFETVTRDQWSQNQQNLNISGGGKVANYFVSIGHTFEDGMLEDFKSPLNYKTTPDYNRTNFRSNIDLKLTKGTTVGVNIGGRLENRYSIQGFSPSAEPDDIYANGLEGFLSRVIAIPSWGLPYFPEYTNTTDPSLIRLSDRYNHVQDDNLGVNTHNPYSLLVRGGYLQTDNNAIETIFTLNQSLNSVLKGLSGKALLGYDAYVSSGKRQYGNRAVYRIDRTLKDIVYVSGNNDPLSTITSSRSGYFKTNLQLSLNYNNKFDKHSVSALLLGQREFRASGTGANYSTAPAPFTNQGIIYNLSYNFDEKYFLQANGSYMGSENYAKSERYGLFPSFSLGYTISNEPFLRDVSWIQQIKFRGSLGLVGIPSAGTGRFYYNNNYGPGTSMPFGEDPLINAPTIIHNLVGNPEVTWEKSVKRNIGVESSFLKGKIAFNADLFDDKRYDILLERNNSSFATYGEALPKVNYGENYNRGYELELKYRNTVGDFGYNIGGQLTYSKNKVVIADEAPGTPGNLKNTGLPIGQMRGYRTLGFFNDQAEVDAWAKNGITNIPFIPGDLKYADLNGDGIINTDDRSPFGYSTIPEYTFGIDLGFNYRGFSISALLQGAENVSSDALFFSNARNQYYEPMLGRWTPATKNSATWPAIREGVKQGNPNEQVSDFYQTDASYLKLRNIQVRYQFGKSVTNKLHVNGLSIFVTGQNLKTWTKFYGYDPENAYSLSGTYGNKMTIYPSTRVLNFGLNIQL